MKTLGIFVNHSLFAHFELKHCSCCNKTGIEIFGRFTPLKMELITEVDKGQFVAFVADFNF